MRGKPGFTFSLFVIPAVIGGGIAWVASGSLDLGVLIFLAIIAGNWIGYSWAKKK